MRYDSGRTDLHVNAHAPTLSHTVIGPKRITHHYEISHPLGEYCDACRLTTRITNVNPDVQLPAARNSREAHDDGQSARERSDAEGHADSDKHGDCDSPERVQE